MDRGVAYAGSKFNKWSSRCRCQRSDHLVVSSDPLVARSVAGSVDKARGGPETDTDTSSRDIRHEFSVRVRGQEEKRREEG